MNLKGKRLWIYCLATAAAVAVTVTLVACRHLIFEGSRSGDSTSGTHPHVEPDDLSPALGPPLFSDRTAESGLAFTYHNGEEADQFTILETLGGGVGLIDYDGDGLLDIYLTGGGYFDGPDKKQIKGYPNRLFKNLGGWKFQDVTREAGLDQPVFYSHGC